MTFTVEDGTGLADANAYVSVADADSYFSLRGNAVWTGSDAVKQAAIVQATDYLDATYRWKGAIESLTQALSFPRIGIYDPQGRDIDSIVPQKVKDACCELAVVALSGALLGNTSNSDYVTREKVGEIEVEYSASAPSTTKYLLVDRLVSGLHNGSAGGANARVIRA